MRNLLFIIFLFISSLFAQAQNTGPLLGTVKGVIRDTINNYNLKSATISLFKEGNHLSSYQLSNTYGEYVFENLPLNKKMYIEVSHVGYITRIKEFMITDAKTPLNLQTMVLSPGVNTLNEVEVRIPPISMNGDTLEFNAAAFKLDTNAVVEDLLRKIPNVTLWGNGMITVNGREVKSFLVGGKEFFGGDAKIATQNIPKNALEKVQVYAQKNPYNPLDSTLTVNLKLKKNKDVGYFGKIGGGYGSTNRYESDGIINFFTKKMQLSIVGAGNNINKLADDIGTLRSNSTFKGVGTNIEYQPDFRQAGLNKSNVGGYSFNYNFIDQPGDSISTLKSNYFVQNRLFENLNETETVTTLNEMSQLFSSNSARVKSNTTNQNFDNQYDFAKNRNTLSISNKMHVTNGETNSDVKGEAKNELDELTSTNDIASITKSKTKNLSLGAKYSFTGGLHSFPSFSVTYDFRIGEEQSERNNKSNFRSFANSQGNSDIDRRYADQGRDISHGIALALPGLQSLLFGASNITRGWSASINTSVNLSESKDSRFVEDLALSGNYLKNSYLSNATLLKSREVKPGLSLAKLYSRRLSNRFEKSLNVQFFLNHSFLLQNNESEKFFQNIRRDYSQFVPAATATLTDHVFGKYYRTLSLNFATRLKVPSLQQLVPLTDSTNFYYLLRGNINLKKGVEREIELKYANVDENGVNTFNYKFGIRAGFTTNKIVDSIFIDNQNRRNIYYANADGSRYFEANTTLNKAIKLQTSALQVVMQSSLQLSKNPGYLNGVFVFANSFTTNNSLILNFAYKDIFATETSLNIGTFKTEQKAFDMLYRGTNYATSLSSSYNLAKRISLGSNITFNANKSSTQEQLNYTIWNASATCRFLKGNNLELKLSALDLLHQNTNVINYAGANSFTLGTQSTLQQYFMTTLSYYPRKFGKKTSGR